MDLTMQPTRRRATSGRQRAGLAIAGLLAIGNIVSVFQPTPEDEVGPPFFILALGAGLGLLALIGAVVAWRTGSPVALRVTAGATIVTTLFAAPAFFVDVPAGVKALVGVVVLLTVAAVVLMFSSPRRPILEPQS